MKRFNCELYLITEAYFHGEDKLYTLLEEAVEGGIDVVQLRYKDLRKWELIEVGKQLRVWLERRGVPLIVNDYPEVAVEIGAAGVHLGQGDMSVGKARKIVGDDAVIGLSIETVEQIVLGRELPVDYVAVSPVFKTKTKVDVGEPMGLEGLREVVAVSGVPVLGIGGITLENVGEVIGVGASGVAVISAIWNASEVRKTTELFKQRIMEVKTNEGR